MTRRRRFALLALVVLAAAALAAAVGMLAGPAARRNEQGASRPVRDATGGFVRVPVHPRRIVSLCAAATETLLALGMRGRLVGVDRHSATRGADGVAVIGTGGTLSTERLAVAEPDLAFVWWYQRGATDQIEGLGVPVVRLRAQSAEEAVGLVACVAEASGAGEAGRDLAQRLRRDLEQLERTMPRRAIAERPAVYVELHAPFKSCGPGSYMHDLVVRAGGRNATADAAIPYPIVSSEAIIAADPDVIVLVRVSGGPGEDVAARPGWSALRAVRAGRVHVVSNDLISPGPQVAAAVRTLRQLLYPSEER